MEDHEALGPSLDRRRLAQRRRHIIDEVTRSQDAPQRAGQRMRRTVVITAAAMLLAGGAAFAGVQLANSTIWRQDDGSVAIDGSTLRPAYQGHYLTFAELTQLQDEGKALASANNRELACQGISLYFDTEVDRDAYLEDFEARHGDDPIVLDAGDDPCAPYMDSPQFVTDN